MSDVRAEPGGGSGPGSPDAAAPDLTLLDGLRWRGTAVPSERAHALLAVLALEPRGLSTQRLAEELWEDDVPSHPAKAVQVLVSRTRAQTDVDSIVRTATGYRLGLPAAAVDVLRMCADADLARSALASGDTSTARDAARRALAVPVGDAPAGGALVRLHREAERVRAGARGTLAFALAGLGEHAEALALLEALWTERPGDESLLSALLRCEAAVRGAPVALARYEEHRRAVRETLGTDPGPELQRLHLDLLARDTPVRAGVRYGPSELIGREEDLAALTAMIHTSRVTSVVGAGGLGKTRLAHVLGQRAEQSTVHFVELAGVTAPSGVEVEVGSALGVRDSIAVLSGPEAASRADLRTRIIEQIGDAPVLLILDNCEHLVEAAAELVGDLVARTPELRVLTTTRAPLGLAAERVYLLPQLGTADGVRMFRERASAARRDVHLDERVVTELVTRLDGLPLAIELAAARVRAMSVEDIARRLENRFALLAGGRRDAPARHQTLLAVIDWSWNLLDEEHRLALRRLSVFRDGFSLDAAAWVLGPDIDPMLAVEGLVEQSLLTVQETSVMRYRLLETVREFGRMQLVDAGEDAVTEEALRRWAVSFSADVGSRLFSPAQVACMTATRREEGNLVDVLRRAIDEEDAITATVILGLLTGFWSIEGNHLKVVGLAGAAERVLTTHSVPPEHEESLRTALTSLVANAMVFSADGTAVRARERLVELGPSPVDTWVAAFTEVVVAVSADDAHGLLAPEPLLSLCSSPKPEVARLALSWMSHARENSGDLPGAIADSERGLELCDDNDGPWTRAALHAQLAGLAVQRGDVDASEEHALSAVHVFDELGATEDAAQVRGYIALRHLARGELEQAERVLGQIAADERPQPMLGGPSAMATSHAELSLARGSVDEGLRKYREAVDGLRNLKLPGLPELDGLEPWLVYSEAAAFAAHVTHGRTDDVVGLAALLAEKVRTLLASEEGYLDYPVAGSVLYALALGDLHRPEATDDERTDAVALLALANRFAYNQSLPSLSWSSAAALADRRVPGELARQLATLGDKQGAMLLEQAHRLLAGR